MKYKGKQVVNDNIQIVVLPRKSGNIVFKFKPVLDYKRFEELVKLPEPPSIKHAGSEVITKDVKNPSYIKAIQEYSRMRSAFFFLESISATEDLEWETVDKDDPTTWHNYLEELEQSQFTDSERIMFFEAAQRANSMNQEFLDEALNDFLASQLPVQ